VNLYLVRHGETANNRDGVGIGRLDEPLTAFGAEQAVAVGERFAGLKLDRVFASPLRRALETARPIVAAAGRPAIEVRNELIELDVGLTEGMAFPVVRARFPDFVAKWASSEVATAVMPGGESLTDVALRVAPLLAELREFPAEAGVALVSHNFVLKVLLCSFLGAELSAFRTFEVGLASVSTLFVRGARTNVAGLNDTCHLAGLNLDHPRRSV